MEAIVDITNGRMLGQRHLEGEHGPGDDEEVLEIARISLLSPMVQKEIDRLQLPEGAEVIAEPWPYGSDDFDSECLVPFTARMKTHLVSQLQLVCPRFGSSSTTPTRKIIPLQISTLILSTSAASSRLPRWKS